MYGMISDGYIYIIYIQIYELNYVWLFLEPIYYMGI